MRTKIKTNEDGQKYEELEGERVQGDGDGDQKFILDDCLTPEEIEKLVPEPAPSVTAF